MDSNVLRPVFSGGANVALKTPPNLHATTVRFYRDTLGLPVLDAGPDSVVFEFGPIRLWVDRSEGVSTPETWLEIRTADPVGASGHFERHDVRRCDAVEPLPDGFPGFWISNPAGQVHLVSAEPGT